MGDWLVAPELLVVEVDLCPRLVRDVIEAALVVALEPVPFLFWFAAAV